MSKQTRVEKATSAAVDAASKYGRRRSLSDILSDPSLADVQGPVGPSIEDDSAAYDRYLASGEAARRREEQAATDQVLENANSRGLARSGIALKDIITQVLGPSAERAGSLAATFGLEQAKNRSNLLEGERNRQQQIRSQRLGGRLSSILNSDAADTQYETQLLGGAQNFIAADEAQQIAQAQADAERRRRSRSALAGAAGGLTGGAIGGFFGGAPGASAGGQIGSSFGSNVA